MTLKRTIKRRATRKRQKARRAEWIANPRPTFAASGWIVEEALSQLVGSLGQMKVFTQ